MALAPQQLRKIFIVGLGSTGTEICDLLAERLENEFGSLEKVPWVGFQCFETNAAQGGFMSRRGDMFPLTISAADYRGLLSDTSALDGEIHFSKYWDVDTLRNIPDISAGVGNVRMAGRLAFFYPANFDLIEKKLAPAINKLSSLSEGEAQQKRGLLPGGANPLIKFLADNPGGASNAKSVVVIVVGTLCGGTSSGLCVDLGYYLRERCPSAHILSIFTLPRPDLAAAHISTAERLKKNAYTALGELHHYSQIGDVEYVAKYPAQSGEYRTHAQPYESSLLAWPQTVTPDGPPALSAAIAERLFLMSFSDTDPFAKLIDVSQQYGAEGETAHTMFGSLGLSTLEHPGPRIADFCAHRLIDHTIGTWAGRTLQPGQIDMEVSGLGASWDFLRRDADKNAGKLEERLNSKADQALQSLAKSPIDYERDLDQIGIAFGDTNGQQHDPALAPNVVPSSLENAKTDVAADLVRRVTGWLDGHLMRWDYGPNACLEVVDGVIANLIKIQAQPSGEDTSDADLRRAADQLKGLRADWLVCRLGLYKRASADVITSTSNALHNHVQQRLDAAIRRSLVSGASREGLPNPGALEIARKQLSVIRRRLLRLKESGAAYAASCAGHSARLAMPPTINGIVLMQEGQADKEYRSILAPGGNEEAFATAQDAAAVELLKAWQDLTASITASTETFYDTALPGGDPQSIGAIALPAEDSAKLIGQARARFKDLLSEDVIQKWTEQENPGGIAVQLVQDAEPFIKFNKAKVQSLLGKPANFQSLAIYPRAGTTSSDVEAFGGYLPAGITHKASEAGFRATILHEYYGIPLEAVPGIVQTAGFNNSLEKAAFTTWKTWSRKNEDGWLPISPEQRQHLTKYRQLLAVGIVMGILQVDAQYLKLSGYPTAGFGEDNYRQLPPNFDAAARKWALDGFDSSGRSLENMEREITNRLAEIRSPQKQGVEGFLNQLENRLQTAGGGMSGWNKTTIQRLINRYCINDEELKPVFLNRFSPSQRDRDIMFCQVGQNTITGPCTQSGFYCVNTKLNCTGYLGADDKVAAQNGWKCPICLTEYHNVNVGIKADPSWFAEAARLKGQSLYDTTAPDTSVNGTVSPTATAPNPFLG